MRHYEIIAMARYYYLEITKKNPIYVLLKTYQQLVTLQKETKKNYEIFS